ncbi:hypothetical protein THAOC_32604, partial [Thalassiosira oceanica]
VAVIRHRAPLTPEIEIARFQSEARHTHPNQTERPPSPGIRRSPRPVRRPSADPALAQPMGFTSSDVAVFLSARRDEASANDTPGSQYDADHDYRHDQVAGFVGIFLSQIVGWAKLQKSTPHTRRAETPEDVKAAGGSESKESRSREVLHHHQQQGTARCQTPGYGEHTQSPARPVAAIAVRPRRCPSPSRRGDRRRVTPDRTVGQAERSVAAVAAALSASVARGPWGVEKAEELATPLLQPSGPNSSEPERGQQPCQDASFHQRKEQRGGTNTPGHGENTQTHGEVTPLQLTRRRVEVG